MKTPTITKLLHGYQHLLADDVHAESICNGQLWRWSMRNEFGSATTSALSAERIEMMPIISSGKKILRVRPMPRSELAVAAIHSVFRPIRARIEKQ